MKLKVKEFNKEHWQEIEEMVAEKPRIMLEGNEFSQWWQSRACIYIPDLNMDVYSTTIDMYDEETEQFCTCAESSDNFAFYSHDTDIMWREIDGTSLLDCINQLYQPPFFTQWHWRK